MLTIFLTALALVWLVFAVVSDLRTKEIPNWLNFSLIIFVLGIRFFYSLFDNDWNILLQGVFGLGVFFILANLLYYGRFFAGGDTKLMIALGPVLPFGIDFLSNASLFLEFLFIFLFAGAVYGMVVLLRLSAQNFLKIKKGFFKKIKSNKTTVIIFFVLGIILMILGYFYVSLFVLGVLIFLTPYLIIYATIVDETCMVERVKTSQLTEGDWLHKDVKAGKEIIKYKWEGLSMREIAILRKKCKYVMIKIGIEFSPVFLISFLIYAYLYFMRINLWNSLW